MLSYPVAAAQKSGLFDAVIVSTEDEEIARIAEAEGADVFERPRNIATDKAGVVDVCLHALDIMQARGFDPEFFCCIYATAVFLMPEDLIQSHAMLTRPSQADFVMGVSEYPIHPYKAMRENEDGFLIPHWPEEILKKGQAFPRFLASNGTLYWARTDVFERTKLFYGENLRGYEVPPDRAIDIDTPGDYERACKRALSEL